MADADGVRRQEPVAALGRRGMELDQLELSVARRRLQERKLRVDPLEPDDAVHPPALDRTLAPRLEPELDEELGCGRNVVDDDADVIHPFDRHVTKTPPGGGLTRGSIAGTSRNHT